MILHKISTNLNDPTQNLNYTHFFYKKPTTWRVGSTFLTLSSMGSARLLFHGGGVQSARSLIGLSRDLIRPFHGHHTHLYSVGVSYGASRKKIFKKSWIMVEFSQILSDNPIFGKNFKIWIFELKMVVTRSKIKI